MGISGLVDDVEQQSTLKTSSCERVKLSLLVSEEAEYGLHVWVRNVDGGRQRGERVQ